MLSAAACRRFQTRVPSALRALRRASNGALISGFASGETFFVSASSSSARRSISLMAAETASRCIGVDSSPIKYSRCIM